MDAAHHLVEKGEELSMAMVRHAATVVRHSTRAAPRTRQPQDASDSAMAWTTR